jgi:hypothetical protein
MEQSILKSTKKVLGVGPDDESFDDAIISHINVAFSDLHQLGVGPETGFYIEDETLEWDDYVDPYPQLSAVKTYIYLKVRLLFDPPQISFVLGALQKQIEEQGFRLNVAREATEWEDPNPPIIEEDLFDGATVILDGGDAG